MKGPVSGRLKKRKTPLPGEIELLRLIGAGMPVARAAKTLGISPHTAHDRIRHLKVIAQRDSLSGLVHWGLRQHHFEYSYGYKLERPSPMALEIILRLAKDQSEDQICHQLKITVDQLQGAIRKARYAVSAKSRYHMVAIAWTEGWIV